MEKILFDKTCEELGFKEDQEYEGVYRIGKSGFYTWWVDDGMILSVDFEYSHKLKDNLDEKLKSLAVLFK